MFGLIRWCRDVQGAVSDTSTAWTRMFGSIKFRGYAGGLCCSCLRLRQHTMTPIMTPRVYSMLSLVFFNQKTNKPCRDLQGQD